MEKPLHKYDVVCYKATFLALVPYFPIVFIANVTVTLKKSLVRTYAGMQAMCQLCDMKRLIGLSYIVVGIPSAYSFNGTEKIHRFSTAAKVINKLVFRVNLT